MRFLGVSFLLLRAMVVFLVRRASCYAPSNTRKACADPWREPGPKPCSPDGAERHPGSRRRPRYKLSLESRKSAPVLALGQGIALIPLSSPPSLRGGWRADKAHGLDRQAGGGTACGRALGVKRHAPHLAARQCGIFGLRLSQRSGHTRSCLSLAGYSRGRPWVRVA